MTSIEQKVAEMLQDRASKISPTGRLEEIEAPATAVPLVAVQHGRRTSRTLGFAFGIACIAIAIAGVALTVGGRPDPDTAVATAPTEDDLGTASIEHSDQSTRLSDGCATLVEGDLVESADFTPYEGRRGYGYNGPLGIASLEVSEQGIPVIAGTKVREIQGMAIQHSSFDEASSKGVYAQGPLDLEDTYAEAIERSIFLSTTISSTNQPTEIEIAKQNVGDRMTDVQVGGSRGGIIWIDPLENDVRPHVLYWSSNGVDYKIDAVMSAEELVNIARRLTCVNTSDAVSKRD